MILLMLCVLLSACKGLNNFNFKYKDRTAILRRLYLELKKDSLDLDKISLLLGDFDKDEGDIRIDTLINTIGIITSEGEGLQSLMHLAVKSHDTRSLQLIRLLKTNMNASVDIRNNRGETPLHLACESGDIDKIKLLIEMGANINLLDNYETTPLIAHIVGDHLRSEIVNILLTSLHEVNQKFGFELKTVLHLVCNNFWKNVEEAADILKILKKQRADFRIIDIRGNTLIHSTVLASIEHDTSPNSTIDMIDMLIRYGADPKTINEENKKALDMAIEFGAHEDVIRYLKGIIHNQDDLSINTSEKILKKFLELIKSYGGVNLEDEGRKNIIHKTIKTLEIEEDNFTQGDRKFLNLLAALFYARWTKDEFVLNMNSNINLNIYEDVDRTLSLFPLIDLMNNIKEKDIDDDFKRKNIGKRHAFDIFDIIAKFSKKIFQIDKGIYLNRRSNFIIKIILQKLVSCLPSIIDKTEKTRFVINTLLKLFNECEVSILGLDQMLYYLVTNSEKNTNIEKLIHKCINQFKKDTLIQTLKEIYPIKDNQGNFELKILKYFSNELNLIEEFEYYYDIDINVNDNFDPIIIRTKFYEKYNCQLIIDTLKKVLIGNNITKLFEYLQKMSGEKNVHLVHKIFFNKDDYSTKEEFIKALLLTLGYISRKDNK